MLPGKIVETQEELTKAVEIELEQFVYNKQYKTFNKTFNCLEGENSAGKILEAVIEENI